MNELQSLTEFRADIPDPDAVQVQSAWAPLSREIHRSFPVGVRPVRRRPSRRVLLWAATAAAVVPLALSFILPHGTPGGPVPAAAAALRAAAVAALEHQPGTRPTDGQYVYVRTRDSATYLYGPADEKLTPFLYTESGTAQRWIGPDGAGRLTYVGTQVSFPTEKDRAAWVAAGSPKLQSGSGAETYRPGELSYLDLSGFPSDPGALLEIIEQREIVGGPPGDWESFAIIGDLLRAEYAPPKVRAGLYELASELSGVEYIGRVTDLAGRVGTAVGYSHNGLLHMLIFDRHTTELLGERTVVVDAEEAHLAPAPDTILGMTGPAGTITYEVAYLDRAVTDTTHEVVGTQ